MVSNDEKNLAVIAHISPVIGYCIGFGQILIPLLIWLFKRNESEYVGQQALEALNYNITMTCYFIIAGLLCFVLIGLFILPLLGIFAIVVTIQASLAAHRGDHYRYPFIFRFIQ